MRFGNRKVNLRLCGVVLYFSTILAADIFLHVDQLQHNSDSPVLEKRFPDPIIRRTGRVLYTTPTDNFKYEMMVAVLLEKKFHIKSSGITQCRFWTLKEMVEDDDEGIYAKAIPAGMEFDKYSDDDVDAMSEIESDFMSEDNISEPEGFIFRCSVHKLDVVTVYEVLPDEFPIIDTSTANDICDNWQKRPVANDMSIFDYLLRPQDNFILHPSELQPRSAKFLHDQEIQAVAQIDLLLNQSQKQAVDNMMSYPLVATIGPAGTGKTSCASLGIIKLALQEDGVIILTTPSNYACDVLYDKVVEDVSRFKLNLKVVRMMSRSIEKADMNKQSNLLLKDQNLLHVQMRRSPDWNRQYHLRLSLLEDRKGVAFLKRRQRTVVHEDRMEMATDVLASANVIVCTVACASDGRLSSLAKKLRKKGRRFSALLIDEASLLTVPETLPVLRLNPLRVWLIGDPMQLTATITDPAAQHACLHVSWMEVLGFTPYVKKPGKAVYDMLDTQYRMAVEIGSVNSSFMYEGRVKCPESVQARNYATDKRYAAMKAEFPQPEHHNIVWFGYEGFREDRQGSSLSNNKEVDIIQDILKRLNGSHIDMACVTVIAMYQAQVKALCTMLGSLGPEFSKCSISTVDGFQGKQNNVVILSFVRSNRTHSIGFLHEVRRLNVAMSRSVDYLFIICDGKTVNHEKVPASLRLFFSSMQKQGICEHIYADE